MEDTSYDHELVKQALQGSQPAWDEIVKTHTPRLKKSIIKGVDNLGYDKDDILQYFWLSVFNTRLVKYDGTYPLNYFLRLELGARLGDLVKRAKLNKHELLVFKLDEDWKADVLDFDIETPEAHRHCEEFKQSIAITDPRQYWFNEAMDMLRKQGLTAKDVAQELGVSTRTIQSWTQKFAAKKEPRLLLYKLIRKTLTQGEVEYLTALRKVRGFNVRSRRRAVSHAI